MRNLLFALALSAPFCLKAQNSIMYVKNDKNPGAAFVIGLVVPGAGQMYNDRIEQGLGVLVVSGGLVVSGLAVSNAKGYTNAGSVGRTMQVAGGAIWFAGAVYAAFQSRKINRDNGVDKRRTAARSTGLEPAREGFGLALTF